MFNILFRMHPARMVQEGFEYGEAGVRAFTETYGLLEKITVIEPADNACSEARVTKRVRRRPGASPLLFGRFLMSLGAFISLEDISEALPPYREEVVSIEMDPSLKEAYKKLEEDVKTALKEHRGNQSVMSVALNALLLYPDRPFHLGDLYGWEFDPETQRREKFLISATPDLSEDHVYAAAEFYPQNRNLPEQQAGGIIETPGNAELSARICELARLLGYNATKMKFLVGQWRLDLVGLERRLQNELDEGPQIPSFQKRSKRSRTTMA